MRDRPMIEQIERTGYPYQEECFGIDYFGNAVVLGEDIIIDHNNGEMVHADDLERYLMQVYNFQFLTAK